MCRVYMCRDHMCDFSKAKRQDVVAARHGSPTPPPRPSPRPSPKQSPGPSPRHSPMATRRFAAAVRQQKIRRHGVGRLLPYAAHVCGCCDVAHTHLPFACCFAVTVSQHAWSRHKLMGSHKLKRVGQIAATRSVLRALQSVAQEIARCCALWWLFRV